MIIRSVELRNVKSYRKGTIEFEEGINGISGENGHGKTTILEAIGYALFDSLPYKEGDFLRRGEKSGYVAVEIRGENGNHYILTRKLGSGSEYSVRGPDIHLQGKKDVLDWVIQNLLPGISKHDELSMIFENAVGVPQGMLTAAFMETPTRRRKIFDEILRVDEYRNAYENLRTMMGLIDDGVKNREIEIDKLRIRTENYEEKKGESAELRDRIDVLKKALDECTKTVHAAKSRCDALRKQKDMLNRLEREINNLQIQIKGKHQHLKRLDLELKKSEEAQKAVSLLSGDKERYEDSKKKLEELEKMRKERDALKDKLYRSERELALLMEKSTGLDGLKKEVDDHTEEKTNLAPKVREQEGMEKAVERGKGERAILLKEINDIKSRMALAGDKNLCPVMKGVPCTSIDDFSAYFHQQLIEAQDNLKAAEDSLKISELGLKALGDPRGRVAMLNSLIERGRREMITISKGVEKIPEKEHEGKLLKKSIERFRSLDTDTDGYRRTIDILEPRYREYLQKKTAAERFMEYKKECEILEKAITEDESTLRETVKRFNGTRVEFSEEALEHAERTYVELEAKVRGHQVEIKEKSNQLEKLEQEVADMEKALAAKRELEFDLKREERFREYARFVRETLRDSAQHIVQEFIAEISAEANDLYCGIMDDFSQEMRWGEDYGIMVAEGGNEKTFFQLSGGERMGAALAVRLALLKVLANSDFVFLDEPTQNMDEIRRESLSQQIMNITGFKQVFVISHDDTFNEKYAHVIKIQKIDGESRVVSCST